MGTINGKENRNMVWGILFLLGAVLLILNKIGFWPEFRFWPSLFSIVLVVLFIDGIIKRNVAQIFFSAAFFIIVNDEILHLEAITPWTVLGAALLGTIGVHLLFPRFGRNHVMHIDVTKKAVFQECREENVLYYKNAFGDTVKYIGGEVSKMELKNRFGSMKIYFSNAVCVNNAVYLYVDSQCGSMELYIPASWRVMINAKQEFAVIEEKGQCCKDGENVLYIEGKVSFGELEIEYI